METKVWGVEEIRALLETNDRMVEKSIVKLWERQTEDEKATKDTNTQNGIGYNHVDSSLMSSFAEQILRGKRLSEKQMVYARKKIMKYAKQITKIANGEL